MDATEAVVPELVWTEPDEEAVVDFLCHTKRVRYIFVMLPLHMDLEGF